MQCINQSSHGTFSGAQVLTRLRRAMPHLQHALSPDRPLQPFTLDSLDFVELLCVIESDFAVQLSESDLERSPNVGAMADLIASRACCHSLGRNNP
jgi:Phosphopantetheine attachment site